MKTRLFLLIILSALFFPEKSHAEGQIMTGRQGNLYGFYSGGKNWLLDPHKNREDWRKRADIEEVQVDDDLTVEEAEYLCQMPNLKYFTLGKSPEVAKLRPGVMAVLAKSTQLEQIAIYVDELKEEDVKPLSRSERIVSVAIQVINPKKDAPVLDDQIGLHLAEMKNLEFLAIFSKSKLTNNFLSKISGLEKLDHLNVSSLLFNEHSLEILGGMNLGTLCIYLPDTSSLSLAGLRKSKIKRLWIECLEPSGWTASKTVLSIQAYETLMAMEELEEIYALDRVDFEGGNRGEKISGLMTRFYRSRSQEKKEPASTAGREPK